MLEVSVVGREHPRWGERPMAFVILHAAAAARWAGKHGHFADALKTHARARLPGFATPEWVEVVAELPVSGHLAGRSGGLRHDADPVRAFSLQKTSTGKILKTALRKRAAAAASSAKL